MNINRENYEAWFLDYHEGRLDPVMAAGVLLFVEQNPDLKVLFNEFDPILLVPEKSVEFIGKDSLRQYDSEQLQAISTQNYFEYLLAETENLLSASQQQSLAEFAASHPEIEKERKLLLFTHLQPDNDITFDGKGTLKHKVIPVGGIDENSFETWLARELEGDLSKEEQTALNEFMSFNPHLQNDRKLYLQTIVQPDKGIVFGKKSVLKQTTIPMRRIVYYSLSAAASIALLAGIFFTFNNQRTSVIDREQAQRIEKPVVIQPVENKVENRVDIPEKNNTLAGYKPTPNRLPAAPVLLPDARITMPVDEQTAMNFSNESQPVAARTDMSTLASLNYSEVVSQQYVDPNFIFIRQSQMYINSNLEYYYNLKLAEQLQYAQLNEKEQQPGRKIADAVAGKFESVLASNTKPQQEKPQVSIWTVAEFGVQTINTLTSSDLQLNLQKDDEGKVIAYGLDTQLFGFEREVKQQEAPKK